MALTTWASTTINQKSLLSGYSENPDNNGKTGQQPQVGPTLERMRSSVPSVLVTWQQILTFTEWDLFQIFYDTTLKNGVLHFTRNHPRKLSTTVEMKFEGQRPQSGQPISATQFMITFNARMF